MLIKIISATIIFILSLLFGFFPKIFSNYSKDKTSKALQNKILGLSNAFSGGIFIGIAFFHLLPEATEAFQNYFKINSESRYKDFPFQFAFAFIAYSLILFIEKIAFDSHSLIAHEHTNKNSHQHGDDDPSHNEIDSHNHSIEVRKGTEDSEFNGLKYNKKRSFNISNNKSHDLDDNLSKHSKKSKNSKISINKDVNNVEKDNQLKQHSFSHENPSVIKKYQNINNTNSILSNNNINGEISKFNKVYDNDDNHNHNHDNNHDHSHDDYSNVKYFNDKEVHKNNLQEPLLYSNKEVTQIQHPRKNSYFECLDSAFKNDVLQENQDNNKTKELFNMEGIDSDEEEAIIKALVGNKGKYMAFLQMRTIKCKI